MADSVYSPTTAPNPKSSCFLVPNPILDYKRFFLKLGQVVLSLSSFVLEELISSCFSCSPLYFFEFMSCTSFLFTLLLLLLLSTSLHQRVGVTCWTDVDFYYTAAIFVLFLLSSIIFLADNMGTTLEKSAGVLGVLASVLFLVDLVFIHKTRGFPWQQDQTQNQTPEQAQDQTQTTAETEKLNETQNGV